MPSPGRRRIPRNLWAVSITSFLVDVSSEMVVNLLPLFLANVLGARMVTIGLIEGAAATTASLVKVFSGALSDRLGANAHYNGRISGRPVRTETGAEPAETSL